MESSPLDLFRLNDLFRGHTAEASDVLRPHLQVERFAPDHVIFEEGETGDSLYLIGAGVVRISKAGRGGQQETLTLLEAGDYFGDMAAFNLAAPNAPTTSSASARPSSQARTQWKVASSPPNGSPSTEGTGHPAAHAVVDDLGD